MIIHGNPRELLIHQLNNWYGGVETAHIDEVVPTVLKKLDQCFAFVNNKYYHQNGETLFNPLHTCQWTMFLYEISRQISRYGNTDLCDKIYGISKCFSSADIYYEVELPDIWMCDHPQGSVIGRAEYGNFFSFGQGCTVGNNKGKYPVIGEHFCMFSDSKILGDCHVGNHVILSANSVVIDCNIPSYSLVFGSGRDLIVKTINLKQFDELSKNIFKYGYDEDVDM